jgi:hypothetical protein
LVFRFVTCFYPVDCKHDCLAKVLALEKTFLLKFSN